MVESTTLTVQRDYRCYFLGRDNRIKDVVEFRSMSDDEAIVTAQRQLAVLRFYAGFELWEGTRQVYVRLPPPRQPPKRAAP